MQTVKLGTICDIQAGGTPSRAEPVYWKNGTIPWVKISDFDGGNVRTTEESITQEGLDNSSAKLFPKGTILYTIFATLGEVAVLQMEAATNQAIAGLHLHDERIDAAYLYYFLISIKEKVLRLGRGVTQNNINLKILRNIDVPVPPLAEQQRIVRELQQVGALLANRRQVDEKLAELPKARFVEMFGDTETHTDLKSACKIITDGTHQPPPFTKQGIPFLFVTNIINNVIRYDAEKFISQETYDALIKRTPIEIGDLLLSTVGSYGHAAIVETDQKFLFQRHIAYLKPDSEKIDSYYLHAALMSDRVQQTIEARVKGIAQKTLNLSEVKKLEVPLPPLSAQRQFAAFARACAAQRAACARQIAVLETLRGKLLQDAFGAAG